MSDTGHRQLHIPDDEPIVDIFGRRIKKALDEKAKRPAVRFSHKVFDELMTYIADGMTTVEACTQEGMPSMVTLYKWLAESDRAKPEDDKYGLSIAFSRAHDIRMELKELALERISAVPLKGEIVEIEYERVPAYLHDETGEVQLDPRTGRPQMDPAFPDGWKDQVKSRKVKHVDMIERARLHSENVKWIMSKRSHKYASESTVRARLDAKDSEGSTELTVTYSTGM